MLIFTLKEVRMQLNNIKKDLSEIKRTSFGISIPELRKYAKKISKNYKEFAKINDNSTFELRLLHAFTLGYAKDDITTLLIYFEKFMPFVDDWAVNDSLCQNFRIARKYQKEVWDFLMKYKASKKEFESRIVAVVLLSHYLNDEYIDRVIKVLDSLNTDDYYSQMGVAWALATVMGFYPEKCLDYLKSKNCNLDETTLKKTKQKIRESFRVDEKIKQIVKNI